DEIKLRRELLEAQPKGIADQYKCAFNSLRKRVKTQLNVLLLVKSLVVVVFLLTAYMAVDALASGSISAHWYGLYSRGLS
ncbi:hypothetical protein LL974_22510, partial [Xanthomonas campestris pv. cannae]|nr:hypothetical protein [Xanthomonas campestris pv. cannae]